MMFSVSNVKYIRLGNQRAHSLTDELNVKSEELMKASNCHA